MGDARQRDHGQRLAPMAAHPPGALRVLGPTGNSRDFAYIDELGMLEFGAALHGEAETGEEFADLIRRVALADSS
jgi:hypothetical protein